MFAAILAAILAAGVAGLNLGVAQYEKLRVNTVAEKIAGQSAVIWGGRIYQWRHCTPTPPLTQCPEVTPSGISEVAFPYACIGAPNAPQIEPIFDPPVWPLLSGPDPVDVTVTVVLTCPSLLGGNATQSVTTRIPLRHFTVDIAH